jgi:dTDP-4-dehydrorhamnose reductase
MKILVTGARGLLGQRLLTELATHGHSPIGFSHTTLDITDFAQAQRVIGDVQPDLVIHCAAMTQVDRCAEQPDEALRVNGIGTQQIALACQKFGLPLAYISTNEVFDGEQVAGYLEYDQPRPINPYGYSKWVGEQTVRDLLPQHYIIRTSWGFAHGGDNFLHKMIKAAARGDALSVVTDEVAAPTYTDDLAEAICRLVETERYGIYHLVNNGRASRYQFARYLLDCAGYTDTPIIPIISAQRPRPSKPPVYGVLRNYAAAQIGITLRHWQVAVADFFVREKAVDPSESLPLYVVKS